MLTTIPKVLIFDLDGTLTESKSPMTVEMGALFAQLLEKMPVAVMSGGALVQFQKQFLTALPTYTKLVHLYLFPTSAAQCYVFKDNEWKTIYNLTFTQEERAKIHSALDLALQETGMDRPPEPVWGERIEDRGAQITFSALGQHAPYSEKKTWDPYRTKRAPLAAALIRMLPDFNIAVNATSSIDITHKGKTKAYGIEQLSKMLNIQISDMLYVGDALFPSGNDYVVIQTGITTKPISSPEETAALIHSLLDKYAE